jgi:hypothetical protein
MLYAYWPGGGRLFFDGFRESPWAMLLVIGIVVAIAVYGTKKIAKRGSRRNNSN